MQTQRLVNFIRERESVRRNKERGAPKPWTDDPILQRYSFCNVERENDRVTMEIADLWRNPYARSEHLWFLMAVARWVNWPATLLDLDRCGAVIDHRTDDVAYKPRAFIQALNKRKAAGVKVWTGAYMIGTQGNATDKAVFIAENVLLPLWQKRKHLAPRPDDTLASFAQRIVDVKNQGKFMVAQIVADVKYVQLRDASDWYTFALSGPGSRRGLNRVLERDTDASWKESVWHAALLDVRQAVIDIEPDFNFHAQDIQNCLCEFDKYERVRLGEGRPRATYPGVSDA